MRSDYSEASIIANCPHCDFSGWAYLSKVEETPLFNVICDSHPLLEGHLLIIPKRHVVCVGDYTEAEFNEFESLYNKYKAILKKIYGPLAIFEHGKIGQTVFHSHVHFVPFKGNIADVAPEDCTKTISNLSELFSLYQNEGQYLFIEIDRPYIIDTAIGAPRFFRDRLGKVLNAMERANWKSMHQNDELMTVALKENQTCINKLKNEFSYL